MSTIYSYIRTGTEIVGGGCALNTARVFQWLCGDAERTALFGGVGDDQAGRLIQVPLIDRIVKDIFMSKQIFSE
jgi:sugar/nucleoside kinase (ribokinase family)